MLSTKDYDFTRHDEREAYIEDAHFYISVFYFNRKRFTDKKSRRDDFESAVERAYWSFKKQ